MSEWKDIIDNEDRVINNSDRRYRRHNISLDCLSDEMLFNLCKNNYAESEVIDNLVLGDFLNELGNEKLLKAVCQLTKKQKIVVTLIFGEGMKHEEVAKRLGCARTTVTDILSRALKSLREILIT